MSEYVEGHGRSFKSERKKREFPHLEIHAGEHASHEQPSWHVVHVYDNGDEKNHEFSDHDEMMNHLRKHTHPDTLVGSDYGEDEE